MAAPGPGGQRAHRARGMATLTLPNMPTVVSDSIISWGNAAFEPAHRIETRDLIGTKGNIHRRQIVFELPKGARADDPGDNRWIVERPGQGDLRRASVHLLRIVLTASTMFIETPCRDVDLLAQIERCHLVPNLRAQILPIIFSGKNAAGSGSEAHMGTKKRRNSARGVVRLATGPRSCVRAWPEKLINNASAAGRPASRLRYGCSSRGCRACTRPSESYAPRK